MQGVTSLSVRALAGVLFLGISAYQAQATTLTIDSVTGTWSNETGNPSDLSGDGTNQIFFGIPITGGLGPGGGQSSYLFNGVASGSFTPGATFTLGTFEHINNPINPNSITGATLNLSIVFDVDGTSHTIGSTFVFTHNETPNDDNPCADGQPNHAGLNINGCADIVTAVTNVGNSQTFDLAGTDFIFAFTGFLVNGQPLTTFESAENSNNSASIEGSFVEASSVPGPIVGAGLPGLMMAGVGFVGWWRRKRKTEAAA